jgi:hypothetical protein
MTPIEQNAMRIELSRLQKENELMRQLVSTEGFFDYFFKKIPEYSSRELCFEAINELYFELFGRYKYANYTVFRQTIARNYKK